MWKKLFAKKQLLICALVFFTCTYIYWANSNIFILSGDSLPNSLLAFNWLFDHTLNFDNFRNGYLYGTLKQCGGECVGMNTPYFLAESPNGHLVAVYPAGVAIVTFPLYFCFYCYLKLQVLFHNLFFDIPLILPSITDQAFEVYRIHCEKIAATLSTSLSVTIFYLCLALKFSTGISLVTTFIYAFATNNWVTSSQALWQHGISNLVVVSTMLCLLKANRVGNQARHLLLILCGLFCGLLPGIRPTSLLFSIAFIVYSIFTYRADARFLLIGLPSILSNLFWNLSRFGFSFANLINPANILIGRYAIFSDSLTAGFYNFSWQQFMKSFPGILISPGRGLLIYSPITLFSIGGASYIFKTVKFGKDEKLIGCLLIASLVIIFQYGFYIQWHAGWSYGARFMTDLLPCLCFLLAYFLNSCSAANPDQPFHSPRGLRVGLISLFLVGTIYSTFTQIVGAFGYTYWDSIPVSSTSVQSRLWNWRDSPIERSARHLFYKINEPIEKPGRYLDHLAGVIRYVTNSLGKHIDSPLIVKPSEEMLFKALLINRGQSQWYGYETGMLKNLMLVNITFIDQNNTPHNTSSTTLYLSGNPKRREIAFAIGNVLFPSEPGKYKARFTLSVQGLPQPKREILRRPFELDINVMPPAP